MEATVNNKWMKTVFLLEKSDIAFCTDGITAVEMYIILNLWRQQVNMEEVLCVQSVGADHRDMSY